MVVGWFLHRPEEEQKVAALVSRSEDGEILSATLEHWGYRLIRGSSHIGGKEAMQLMIDSLTEELNVRYPRWTDRSAPSNEDGWGSAAQQSGRVPTPFLAGMAAGRKKVIRVGDRFEIPLPFSCVLVCLV